MSRYRTAVMLLQHGPLKRSDFAAITGWPEKSVRNILQQLLDAGAVTRPKRGVYQLAP